VTKTEFFLVKLDNIHDSTSSSLVILGLCNSLSSQNVVSTLKFRIHHFVWKSFSTNSNTSKYTIALVLMHDKSRLNTSRYFVSVGHNTTNEMRLSFVKGTHQIIKLALEVR
jgi:hypothetical protein